MVIYSYASLGYEGELVTVEVDLRPALPGFEIVGLPDSAIREAKERIRVAIRNSGFDYPTKRILVNLYPAGIPKAGASFDLPIALGILAASGVFKDPPVKILAMGELQLSGRIRPADGVIAALHESGILGNLPRLVPEENRIEAAAAGMACTRAVRSLSHAAALLRGESPGEELSGKESAVHDEVLPDFADMAGSGKLARVMQIAAVGGHNMLLYGPPGSGKTMAALRLPSILPDLDRQQGLEVTRIYSVAGKLPRGSGLIRRPPFRKPHHSASREGLIGGGPVLQPGEVSLAHNGVLLLDEAGEFQPRVLQALREPAEQRRVDLVRAGRRAFYPARFQLLVTLNPCPCGNLGKEDAVCLCSEREIHRYWKTLGGALLDRMDIRLPLVPLDGESLMTMDGTPSEQLRAAVEQGRSFGGKTRGNTPVNSELSGKELKEAALLNENVRRTLLDRVRSAGLSNRAVHSILRVARSAADLDGSSEIREEHIREAADLRGQTENLFFSGVHVNLG